MTRRSAAWFWTAGLAALPLAARDAPDRERIYLERCARWHETTMAQMPTRAALADRNRYMQQTPMTHLRSTPATLQR